MKYIDAEKLTKAIEDKGLDCSFALKMERLGTLALIDSLQQEQPEESIAKEAIQLVFEEKLTPFKDGNQWCFLLGHNIQEGVCGFGDTILDAAIDFYKDYSTTRIHIGELKKTMEQPEVDLEKEWKSYMESRKDDLSGNAVTVNMKDLARHFYELGQHTKYQQIQAEFTKFKTKEWQDGNDEGCAKGLNTRKEESVSVAESPLKTFSKVNEFDCGSSYRH